MKSKILLSKLNDTLWKEFKNKDNTPETRAEMAKRSAEILKELSAEDDREYDVEVTGVSFNKYDVVIREIPKAIYINITLGPEYPDTPQLIPLPEEAKAKILSSFEYEAIDAHLVFAIRQAVRNYVADEMYISPEKFFVTIDTENAHRGEIGVAAHYYPKCKHCDKRSTQDITGVGDFVCESHINKEMV